MAPIVLLFVVSPVMNHAVLQQLWSAAGETGPLPPGVTLSGTDPALPSSFRIGTAAQASIAAAALAAREIGVERGAGPAPRLHVDMRHAVAEFRSERWLRVDGRPPPDPWDALAGLYPCGDGGWVRLHTNFPHHRAGIVQLLGCADERAAVAQALLGWEAAGFEQAAADAGLCAAALRSFDQWDAHPQGRAVAAEPLIRTTRLDASAPRRLPPLAPGIAPLAGLKVLDLTRVIAGPVASRTLAFHGAQVLRISAAHLPALGLFDADTGRGKRSAEIDLRHESGRAALRALAAEADVFVQSYRPGALHGRGFGAAALAQLRPGIVVASLSAYGTTGPWAGRRGFDSLVQTAAGFNAAEAQASGRPDPPRALPAQALDHGAGMLLAFGALQALRRRAREGGSWHVEVSLARTASWLRGLGRVESGFGIPDSGWDDVQDLLESFDSGYGRLTAVRHAARFDPAPSGAAPCASPLGRDAAAWIR